MTNDRVTVFATDVRRGCATAAMLARNLLCAAMLLYFSSPCEAVERSRLVIVEQQSQTEATASPAEQPSDQQPAIQQPVAGETSQPSIVTVPTAPRSLVEVQAGLQAIAAQERELSSMGIERERQRAVIRLRMYRFLCRLPHDDLILDSKLNDDALAAADICRRLGRLSHAPENPGLPDAEYQVARGAAGKCNLSFGTSNLTEAIDLWMDDSDARNFSRLGHRRWCLNPKLLKLGLGRSEDFCAMWAFDKSRTPPPEYEFISFPPPGYVPVDMFDPAYAWSLSLNPGKYLAPNLKAITVEAFPMRQGAADREHSLNIEHLMVDTQGFGVNNCVIFRPQSLEVRPLQSYQLDLHGLQTIDGKPIRLSFAIHFIDPISAAGPN